MTDESKVKLWYRFNAKTRLFWKEEGGWGKEVEALTYTPEEKKEHAPLASEDEIWVPYMSSGLTSNDDLIDVLSLFPKGTPITAAANHNDHRYDSVKIFGIVLNQETLEDAEADTDPDARLFIYISAF